MSEGNFSQKRWRGAGTDCPERLWMLCPWRYSRPGWVETWATYLVPDLEVGGPIHGRGVGI